MIHDIGFTGEFLQHAAPHPRDPETSPNIRVCSGTAQFKKKNQTNSQELWNLRGNLSLKIMTRGYRLSELSTLILCFCKWGNQGVG